MSCAPCNPPCCTPPEFCTPENFGLLFPDLVGPMGPPGGPGTYVPSFAELRLLDATIFPNGYQAFVSGYAGVNDGGGGVFTYVSAGTDADNDGTIIAPSNGIGRWFRSYTGAIDVRWFGATGGGVADDTLSIQNALDLAADGDGELTVRGVRVYFPTGLYLITSLTIARGVIIEGDGPNLTILKRSATTGYGILFDSTGLTPGDVGDRVTIRGISLFQLGTATNGGGIYVNGVTSAAQAIIENVRVEDCYRGILTTNTVGSYLKDVQVFSSVVDGFYFTGNFFQQTAINCLASDCASSGFSGSGGSYSAFFGCAANDNVDNGFYMINCDANGFYACSSSGNEVGLYMTTSHGNVIDGFFTYVKINADNAILLDDSDNNELRNISSEHQNAAYGLFMVHIVNGSVNNTLSVGTTSNNWPSGLTNVAAAFDIIRNAGDVIFNTTMTFMNAFIGTNLPTVDPAVTGQLWNDGGIVTVSP